MLKHALLLLSACGLGPELASPPAPNQDELTGGYSAAGDDAVGSLGFRFESTFTDGLCTATLIAPTAVLTSAHCADGLIGAVDAYVLIGHERYALAAGQRIPEQDIAVLHLDRPVEGIAPIALGKPLTQNDMGRRFVVQGFDQGVRKMGALTVNATGGRKFAHLFGDYATFAEQGGCGSQCETLWDTRLSETEAFAGLQPGDVQVCFGDAGGPLLQTVYTQAGRSRQTFGVLSHGWFTATQPCYGAFYATFDERSLTEIAAALAWVDPCEGVSSAGMCTGTVVSRCTTYGEGERRVNSYDCASVDQQCTTLANGSAGCTDVVSDPGSAPSNALAPDEVRKRMQGALSGRGS